MAIVFAESFGFTSQAQMIADGWAPITGEGLFQGPTAAQMRFSAHNSCQCGDSSAAHSLPSNYSEGILSVAVYATGLADDDWIYLRNGTTIIAKLGLVTSGASRVFRIRNGSNTLLGTGTTPVIATQWVHIQLRIKVHASTGQAELRLNGAAGEINVTGVNTGSLNIDNFALRGVYPNSFYYSDLVFQDMSGSAPGNTFLGDTRYILPLPTGNSATNNAWTANTGTKYGAVDEVGPNSDTDYISNATPGDRQTFTNAALGVTGPVYAVQVTNVAKKDDAATRTIAPVVRQGSTNYDGTTSPGLGSGYASYKQLYELAPDGSAWDVSRVNAAEFGVKTVA